jgi:hypothetical protein
MYCEGTALAAEVRSITVIEYRYELGKAYLRG